MDSWHLVPVAKLVWAARLWQLGLVRRWPWLTAYLVGSAVLGRFTAVTIDQFGWNSVASAWVLPAARVLHYTTGLCVAFEAYENVDAKASGNLGNRTLARFAAAAVVLYVIGDWPAGAFWIVVEPLACFAVAGACVVCWWGVKHA